jgi:hypothetical protein
LTDSHVFCGFIFSYVCVWAFFHHHDVPGCIYRLQGLEFK